MNTGSGWSTNVKILQIAICLDYLRFNCVKSWEGIALSYQIGQCDVTEEANIRWPLLWVTWGWDLGVILLWCGTFCERCESQMRTWRNIKALLLSVRFMSFSLLHSPASLCCIIHKRTWNHVMSRALFVGHML